MARRLLLSYIAVIIVTVASLGLSIQLATYQTFSRYLTDQADVHSKMLPVMLAGHFAENGTWQNVQPRIDEASTVIGEPITLADTQGRIVAASQRDLIGQPARGNDALGLPIPVMAGGGSTVGIVYVGRTVAQQRADQAFLANVTEALVIAGCVVALLAMGLGVLLARSISRPLAEMSRAAARIAQGDYTVRVSLPGQDEVATLALAFNQMAEGISSVERLRRELVANVSHDLRTPLTVIRGYLDGLRSDQIADRRSAEIAFDAMHAEVSRLLLLVDDLRQVAALDAKVPLKGYRPAAIASLVADTIGRIAPLATTKEVNLVNQVPADLPLVNMDSERMGQVLFNLLENAVRHTPAGGSIFLQAGQKNSHLWLSVRDTGEGIPPEHLPHIFERFYRVDSARRHAQGGAGLGLAIVKATVEAHGGQVTAQSDGVAGHGSTFTLSLPL